MTFLHASLLAGLLAIAVPVIVHLTGRRQPKRVTIGSIQFLNQVYQSTRTRVTVRRWWLLALRVIALTAMALLLAAPAVASASAARWTGIAVAGLITAALVVTGSWLLVRDTSRTLAWGLVVAAVVTLVGTTGWAVATALASEPIRVAPGGPITAAVVIDNGPLSAAVVDQRSQIEVLRTAARGLIETLPRGSRVAVVDRSSVPPRLASVSGANARIAELETRDAASSLAGRIDAASRMLSKSDSDSKHVFVFTGGSASDWPPADTNAPRSNEASTSDVSLHVIRAASLPTFNYTIDAVRPVGVPAAGVSVPLEVDVSVNFASMSGESGRPGDDAVSTPVAIELRGYRNDPARPVIRDDRLLLPDSSVLDRTETQLDRSVQTARVALTMPPRDSGIHHFDVVLIRGDELATDDVFHGVMSIRPPAEILVIGDDTDETFVIRQTLAAGGGGVDRHNVAPLLPSDLAVIDPSRVDAMVLLDPAAVTLRNPVLTRFIEMGGSVLIALGPRLTDKQADIAAEDLPGWMPKVDLRWRPEPASFLVPRDGDRSETRGLVRDVPFADYPVRQYWRAAEGTADDDATTVLVNYAGTGHPALLKRSGDGSVYVLTTPIPALVDPAKRWNDLFGDDPWPIFLLVRQTVDAMLLDRDVNLTIPAGGVATVPVPGVDLERNGNAATSDSTSPGGKTSDQRPPNQTPPGGFVDDDAAKTSLQLFLPPDGEVATAISVTVAADADSVTLRQSDTRGHYWLRRSGATSGYAVNVPRTAIDVRPADDADVLGGPVAAPFADAELVDGVDQLTLRGSDATPIVPLRAPMLILAVVAFIVEQIISNRAYR